MKEKMDSKDIRSEEEEKLLERRMAAERWVHDACLLDDYAAKIALKDNVEAAEEMLRPLLGDPKLKLRELRVEETIPPARAGAREIRFDAVGIDGEGNSFDIEFQTTRRHFSKDRALYHVHALAHTNALEANDEFTSSRRTVVVFFMGGDFFRKGAPVCRIYPVFDARDGEPEALGRLFEVYFADVKSPNAVGELGRLFADLIQNDPSQIASPALAKALGVVKNIPMDEENIQSIIDHMSPEQYARYQRRLAAATRKGEQIGEQRGREEGERIGERIGRERLVAELLRDGFITREAACRFLGVDDSELDVVLEKYLDAE